MSAATSTNKAKLLDELRKSPVVQVACQRTGVGRTTYYRWLKQDKSFAEAAFEALDHGISIVNDMAESMMIQAIREKNMTAIIYWLKSHHPAYETRIKLDGRIKHESEELTPEQLAEVAKSLQHGGLIEKGDNHGKADKKAAANN